MLHRQCVCSTSGPTGECEAGGKKKLHRRQANLSAPSCVSELPPIVHEVLRSQGQPLAAATRQFMEPRFNHDFSKVRIHQDAKAQESARLVNAFAYTVGSDVVFGAGHCSPGTAKGDRLLAHELAHVVQQAAPDASAAQFARTISHPSDSSEREAEAAANTVMRGDHFRVNQSPSAELQALSVGEAVGIGFGVAGGVALLGLGIAALAGAFSRRALSGSDKIQMTSGRYVGNIDGEINNLREEVLTALDRLHILGAITDGDYNLEYPAVVALPPRSSVPKTNIPKTIAALRRLSEATLSPPVARTVLDLTLTANVGQGQPNNRADIYALQDALHGDWNLSNSDYSAERTAVDGVSTPRITDRSIPRTIEGIPKMKTAFVSGAIRQDLFAGTHAATPTQHANIEHVLNPTTVLVPGGGGPPTVTDPPAMTGTGPGGTFETEMLNMLNNNVGGWAASFRTLRAESGQPAFPVVSASTNNIAHAAQGEVERYYSPYIRGASRAPADVYHPGAYSLVSKLGDESNRGIDDDARRGWLDYFMSLRSPNCRSAPCGQSILDSHNYVGSRDRAEFDRVRDQYMSTSAHVTDIDDTIHGWPAEAGTGTVFIQPYQRISNVAEGRTVRWRLFTTLIHEMMHIIMHPNFAAAANRIGGTARKILVEGFAEVFRTELWSGTGQLQSRLATPEMAPVREQVEGTVYPYDDSVVEDSGYYDQLADATRIDSEVGRENSKAAFFLGHTELLGLGAGTRTERGSLAGIALYEPTDSSDAEVIVAVAGESYAGLQSRSGASPGLLLDDATATPLPVDAPIAPGTRVRIPGIRWVRAITGDTLGSVAQQHHVTVPALALANQFPVGAPSSTPLVAGTRVLIPIHQNLP